MPVTNDTLKTVTVSIKLRLATVCFFGDSIHSSIVSIIDTCKHKMYVITCH